MSDTEIASQERKRRKIREGLVVSTSMAVSYTHLTLPTIYSV